jgi:hypothetical protein
MRHESSKRKAESALNELGSLTDIISNLEIPSNTKKIRQTLRLQIERLSGALDRLDPTLKPTRLFDPSDPQTSGRIIALTVVAQPRHPLTSIRPFYGAGVYAIYYNGPFRPYALLSQTEQPIYVGKADPADPRAKDAVAQGTALHFRLSEHARNIAKATSTLDVEHFECRFLVVQSGYQRAAEEYLINFFRPIWNSETKISFGLGKHGDDPVTRANARSPWDTLHPGRPWADGSLTDQKPASQIVEEIAQHLRIFPPHATVEEILTDFIEDLRQLTPPDFQNATELHAEIEISGEMGSR